MALQEVHRLVLEHALLMVPMWQLNTISHLLHPALDTPSTWHGMLLKPQVPIILLQPAWSLLLTPCFKANCVHQHCDVSLLYPLHVLTFTLCPKSGPFS
eukprot:1154603-Pelagomonas_calceolata.AAC.3